MQRAVPICTSGIRRGPVFVVAMIALWFVGMGDWDGVPSADSAPPPGYSAVTHYEHAEHARAIACGRCHHMDGLEPEPRACADCHDQMQVGNRPTLQEAAHAVCRDCHLSHFAEQEAGCSRCHLPLLPGYTSPAGAH